MRGRLAIVAWCVTLFISSGAAANSASHIVLRDNVPHEHRDQLLNKLQKITGWTRLRFAPDGELTIDANDVVGGSKIARNLLTKAVTGKDLIVLEDASSRPDIAFCRVVPGRWRNENSANPVAYVVLIDFTDFE